MPGIKDTAVNIVDICPFSGSLSFAEGRGVNVLWSTVWLSRADLHGVEMKLIGGDWSSK